MESLGLLGETPAFETDAVDVVLRRRGHVVVGTGNTQELLVPVDERGFGPSPALAAYRKAFGGSTFRTLVRQVIGAHPAAVPLATLGKTAGDGVPGYIDILAELGVAQRKADGVLLSRGINNIGPSLEWYVAQLCKQELCESAEWGVQLADIKVGGDYDVLAWLAPLLVYVELKSSRPSNIDESAIANFLERGEELAPDLAIFLVDVDKRDDLANLRASFSKVIDGAEGKAGGKPEESWRSGRAWIRPQAEYPGVGFGYRRFYVTNSDPTILKQLQRCLQHYYARVKGAMFLGGPGEINFVTGTRNSLV